MPLIQAYRQAYPQASDDDLQRLIACDAFMRRAAAQVGSRHTNDSIGCRVCALWGRAISTALPPSLAQHRAKWWVSASESGRVVRWNS